MRDQNFHIAQFFIVSAFCLALLFPIGAKTVHAFGQHKHEVCSDLSSHLHEKQLDCSICDFHFSFFHFQPLAVLESIASVEVPPVVFEYVFNAKTGSINHFFLRGPPLLS